MIAVVGATGYIGRYFCSIMQQKGVDVLALGRSKKVFDFFKKQGIKTQFFDVTDQNCFEQLSSKNIDAIIDLSACLAEIETPVQQFFMVNTVGAYNILEYARKHDIDKVIITSTHKVYNDVYQPIISEETPINFTGDHSPYIISKIAAENFVTYYNKDFHMHAIALRLTGVHGYGEVLGHLNADGTYTKSAFEIFFEKALKGQPIEVWGNQKIKRDHVYIKDVVSALYAAAISGDAHGIFNIASGVAHSQYEEACVLADVFQRDKKSVVTLDESKPGLKRGYLYSITKAEHELNWRPQYTDLHDMYEDYKKEWLKKTFHNYHYFAPGQAPETL